jgi:TfoX/Sxy family transcriptional regulator of competence genes
MNSLDAHLKALVDEVVRPLAAVTTRRMFGCDAWFARANIFTLVWDGRVAVKLPQAKDYAAAMAEPGAEGWKPMPSAKNPMAHWVLVSEGHHDDLEALTAWVKRAYAQALAATQAVAAKAPVARREVVFKASPPPKPAKKPAPKRGPAKVKKTPRPKPARRA